MFFVVLFVLAFGAAEAAAAEHHLMPVPPPIPDAQWLWANEPCRAACPVHTDAGAYVTAIAEGRHEDAYLIARAPNPFPSVCGRVCAAPCERGVPARLGRCAGCDPGAQAIRHRAVRRRELRARTRCGTAAHGEVPDGNRRDVGIIGGGPGRARGGVRPAPGRSSGDDVRGAGAARRDDGARNPRVPASARADRPRDRSDRRARHRRSRRALVSATRSRSTSSSRGTRRCSSRSAPVAPATSISRVTSSTVCCAPSSTSSTSIRGSTSSSASGSSSSAAATSHSTRLAPRCVPPRRTDRHPNPSRWLQPRPRTRAGR